MRAQSDESLLSPAQWSQRVISPSTLDLGAQGAPDSGNLSDEWPDALSLSQDGFGCTPPSKCGALQVKREALLKSLEPAGFVWELHMPTSADGETHIASCAQQSRQGMAVAQISQQTPLLCSAAEDFGDTSTSYDNTLLCTNCSS